MAFEIHAVRLLLDAARDGVSFEHTLTLGRTALGVRAGPLQRAFRQAGLTLNDDEAVRLTSDGYAEALLRRLGAVAIDSVDASDYEGATIMHDLNREVPADLRGRYSAVIDAGTLEHVFNVPMALANCMWLLRVGGRFLAMTPCNNYMGHGFYQFSPELFWRVFGEANGFVVERMVVCEMTPNAPWYAVADPAAIGTRVTLRNRRETQLLVQARKCREVAPLALAVQQSDYVALWRDGGPPGPRGATGWRGPAARVLPEALKSALRPVVARIAALAGPYRPPAFRRCGPGDTAPERDPDRRA
jgi:hypothetical protein